MNYGLVFGFLSGGLWFLPVYFLKALSTSRASSGMHKELPHLRTMWDSTTAALSVSLPQVEFFLRTFLWVDTTSSLVRHKVPGLRSARSDSLGTGTGLHSPSLRVLDLLFRFLGLCV